MSFSFFKKISSVFRKIRTRKLLGLSFNFCYFNMVKKVLKLFVTKIKAWGGSGEGFFLKAIEISKAEKYKFSFIHQVTLHIQSVTVVQDTYSHL